MVESTCKVIMTGLRRDCFASLDLLGLYRCFASSIEKALLRCCSGDLGLPSCAGLSESLCSSGFGFVMVQKGVVD